MTAFVATAFLIGLAGGVHCIAMCGGFVAALNFRSVSDPRPPTRSGWGDISRQLAYSLGRVASYAAFGALVGAVGGLGLLYKDVLPVQIALVVGANTIVILLGLSLAGFGTPTAALERTGHLVWQKLTRLLARLAPTRSGASAFAVGVLWGCLPCGLVYSVLAIALAAGSALRGAAVMAAFGLGTLPNLLAAGFAADRLQRMIRQPLARRIAGIAVILLGALGLARIPWLSDHLWHGSHSLH